MPEMDLATLAIERVIIHEVLRQSVRPDKAPPNFSEAESSLNNELRLFLKERIVGALSRDRAYNVTYLDPETAFASLAIRRVFEAGEDFVEVSKDAATHLNGCQGGNSPTGLLTFVEVSMHDKKGLALLKLEREEGARIERATLEGKPVFDLKHLRDLILTEKTKLFKVALFLCGARDEYGFDGRLCDNQLTTSSRHDVAAFFLEKFLGCRLAGDPKADTREFFLLSQDFFNTEVNDPLVSSRYNLHLLSYLSQKRRVVNPRVFANENLAVEHRSGYIQFLEEHGVAIRGFGLDISLIESKLATQIVEFENGVKITGRQQNFSEAVKLTEVEGGQTRAEIVSRIIRVK